MLDLAVLILTYNTKKITLRCLSSIFAKLGGINFGVYVLDNGDDDTNLAIKDKFPDVSVFKTGENLGFVKGNNFLIKKVYKKARYVLLLNSDTEVFPSSLDNLFNFANNNNADISSGYLINKLGNFQPNAGDLPSFLATISWVSGLDDLINKTIDFPSLHQNNLRYYVDSRKVGWVSGAAMLIKSSLFDKIGFFDEKIFMYGEDIDFCWRANSTGAIILWTHDAKIKHLGGASSTDSKYTQWKGEFAGLKYLFKKYYSFPVYFLLVLILYIFLILRIVGYTLIGKSDYAKTYAKIAVNI